MMEREEIFDILKEKVITILEDVNPHMITMDKRLKDLGANSIDRIEIVTMTLEALNTRVNTSELGLGDNIESLVDVLYNRVNS